MKEIQAGREKEILSLNKQKGEEIKGNRLLSYAYMFGKH
jgi:hypothetical protein